MHEEPYLKDGCVVLVAIDSRGEERKRVKLLPGVAYTRAKHWLEELLDRVDPAPPPLALVRETPAVRRERKLHAAHVDDPHAYRRRLIHAAAHRMRIFRD